MLDEEKLINEKILLSPKEAMKILGVGRNEIYKLCRQKTFPAFCIGKKYYINRARLQEWVDKRCK